jgi:hypothetical protein
MRIPLPLIRANPDTDRGRKRFHELKNPPRRVIRAAVLHEIFVSLPNQRAIRCSESPAKWGKLAKPVVDNGGKVVCAYPTFSAGRDCPARERTVRMGRFNRKHRPGGRIIF